MISPDVNYWLVILSVASGIVLPGITYLVLIVVAVESQDESAREIAANDPVEFMAPDRQIPIPLGTDL
jgi:hypothetical protein